MNKLSTFGLMVLVSGVIITLTSSSDGTDFLSGLLVGSGIGITAFGFKK